METIEENRGSSSNLELRPPSSASDGFHQQSDGFNTFSERMGNSAMGRSDGFGTSRLYAEERKDLARKESRAVRRIRIVAYVVAITAGISACLAVYFVSRKDQQDEFETQFTAFADKVAENFYESVERKIGAVHVLSTAITSHAVDTGSTFPNVTMPHFEYHGANTRIQSDSVLFYYSPVVTNETRLGWEAYAATNRYSVISQLPKEAALKAKQDTKYDYDTETNNKNNNNNNNTRMLQEGNGTTEAEGGEELLPQQQQVTFADGYNYKIWGASGVVTRSSSGGTGGGGGPMVPIWQITPAIPNVATMNYDLMDHPAVRDALGATIDTEQVVMSQAHDLQHTESENDNGESMYNAFLLAGQYRHDDQTAYQTNDPTTNIIYPVFDSFGPNRTIGGILMSSMYWRLNFVDILPETAKGIICCMKNSLNQTFTYVINGPTVSFLGEGDHHDSKYDDMVVSIDVTEKLLASAGPRNQGFDAADLNVDHCRYQLFVYPSQETEDQYINLQPILFAFGVALLFIFTNLVFLAYDMLVARRQKIIKYKALESAVIVSSLYPKHVRNRMFQKDDTIDSVGGSNHKKESNPETRNNYKLPSPSTGGCDLGPPIADYYDASTVLFADLAGFTKWSSSRNASDVFTLLETLYLAFDKIAARRNVFKVETVGDCYVAVTGVPEPQEDHPLIMVKFARDCYRKMNDLLPSLAERLGSDTSTLQFRVGMHSGPITGGVLRGAKSRFQLFGDTINTASRMESNGVPGKIHVSQETADLLIGLGYDYWLEAREDKIVAKGKGELHTFFVSIRKTGYKTTDADAIASSSHDLYSIEDIDSFPDLSVTDEAGIDVPQSVSFEFQDSKTCREVIKEYGPEVGA